MEQAELLRYAVATLDAQGIAYMVVGSLASGVFGDARSTYDIDIVVDLQAYQVHALCQAFPAPEYYVSLSAASEAVARGSQFNVIHPASGNKIDFLLAGRDAWGRSELSRRQTVHLLPDLEGTVASVEDVILGKLRYYREGEHEKHLRDIAAMVNLSGQHIDRAYMDHWAEALGLSDIWQTILDRVNEAS